jgi:2-polyprenyl-3-methyl-5-hydroxy-6-metoxy-1,4-benzoquinol methylase
VWADVELPDDRLHALYGRRYFHGDEYTDYTADRAELESNFARRMAVLRRFLDRERHRRLFELGCAYGYFLNAVRGEFGTVEGIDVSEDAVRFAREQLHLPVLHGDLLTTDLGDRRYDVVCMWDTIEHLKTPDSYVGALGGRVAPGGLIALTTGDIGSLNARIRRARWRLIHPPTHVHYFSRRSIARLLDRFGFDVVHVEYCGFSRSLRSVIDGVFRLRWGLDGLAAWLQRRSLAGRSVYLNLRDIMYVIAIKRDA